MKEHNIQLGLSPAPPIIPNVIKTFKDDVSVSLLMHCSIASTLDHMLQVFFFHPHPPTLFFGDKVICHEGFQGFLGVGC